MTNEPLSCGHVWYEHGKRVNKFDLPNGQVIRLCDQCYDAVRYAVLQELVKESLKEAFLIKVREDTR